MEDHHCMAKVLSRPSAWTMLMPNSHPHCSFPLSFSHCAYRVEKGYIACLFFSICVPEERFPFTSRSVDTKGIEGKFLQWGKSLGAVVTSPLEEFPSIPVLLTTQKTSNPDDNGDQHLRLSAYLKRACIWLDNNFLTFCQKSPNQHLSNRMVSVGPYIARILAESAGTGRNWRCVWPALYTSFSKAEAEIQLITLPASPVRPEHLNFTDLTPCLG